MATKKVSKKKAPAKKKAGTKQTARQKAEKASQEFAAENLARALVEKMVDEIRELDQPWSSTSESEQSVVLARISDTVRRAVTDAALTIAARGSKAVVCNLFSVTFKDGVRAVITMPPGSDMRHELADRATEDVVMVFADPGDFMQGLDGIEADKDQPDLPGVD